MVNYDESKYKYPSPGGLASLIPPFQDHHKNIAEAVLQLDT